MSLLGRWDRLLAMGVMVGLLGAPAMAELPVEHITIARLPPDNGRRLYLADFAIAHGVDGKIHVVDGDSFRMLGMFSNGSFGVFGVAADGRTLYNATTYFSRGDHGARTEVLEFYDAQKLVPTGEVVLPPKRAQSSGVGALMPESAKGAYLFIQNATPATSVTVVDLAHRAVLTEIPTAGCYGIYPSVAEPGRFSALCGDGTVLTVGFDSSGHETSRRRSAVLFDPDADPLFINGVQAGERTLFVSFLGNVHEIDMSGPVASQATPWSIVASVPHAASWRPGGVQPLAYAAPTGQLYVAMHANGHEGSHKDPAQEIWKVDVARHMVVARGRSEGAIGLEVSREPVPVLFAVNGDAGSITSYDGDTLAKRGESRPHVLEYGGPIFVH
jgi:methylamine dehydrogenase heavy chain